MRFRILSLFVACTACTVPGDGEPIGGTISGGTSNPDDSSGTTEVPPSTTGTPDDTDGSSSSSSGADETTSSGIKLDVGPEETGGPIELAEVFGHSATTLYRLDPDTSEVTVVGNFTGCTNSIIDIALDADSNMYGTAFGSLWSIDRTTGACTFIASGSYPTSLSFVPAGTIDATEEALVGFVDAQYIRIDTTTGAITNIATLGGGLASSGDLVSVIGGGTYLTVHGPGCEVTDCIVELNPSNGLVLQNYGPLPYDQVFGLAFWGGRAFGFAREGVLFAIDFNGASVSTTAIPIPVAPPNLEFFGAGSTTSAPPVAG